MNSDISLKTELSKFVFTERYYRISRHHLLTDGTKFLAEQAQCFWLMDAIASHLHRNFGDHFCVAKLKVKDTKAVLAIDDGNGTVYATQRIAYTDFPLNEIKLYCSFDGEHWVIMLTSEY